MFNVLFFRKLRMFSSFWSLSSNVSLIEDVSVFHGLEPRHLSIFGKRQESLELSLTARATSVNSNKTMI